MYFILITLFIVSFSFAAEQKLAGNFIFSVMPSLNSGEVLAVSHGESFSAINKIEMKLIDGEIQVEKIEIYPFSKEYSLVDDYIFLDNTGKHKKSLWKYEGGELYLPYYGLENSSFTKLMGAVNFKNGVFELKPDYSDFDTIPKTDEINGIDVAVNSNAEIGGYIFSAALGLVSNHSFLLRTSKSGERKVLEMPNSEFVVAVADFPITSAVRGLAVATFGNGLLFSADTGKTWKNTMNKTPVGDNLGSIRIIPSVLKGNGATSLIAYKVSENSKITIEVFSYDMRKVRTIVKNVTRFADPVRSTNANEDFWDGKDNYGRPAALGTYYIKVTDNHGNTGWGKVMYVH